MFLVLSPPVEKENEGFKLAIIAQSIARVINKPQTDRIRVFRESIKLLY